MNQVKNKLYRHNFKLNRSRFSKFFPELLLIALFCLISLNFIPISNNLSRQSAQSFSAPNNIESSNIQKVTIKIFEIPISSNSVKIVFQCDIFTTEALSYYYYSNQSLIQFGIISPTHQTFELNLTVSKNGDYYLSFELYNASYHPFYTTSYIYNVDSLDNSSNLISLSPSSIYILTIIGIGVVISIPTYIVGSNLVRRKQNHELKDLISGKDPAYLNSIPLQSIRGNRNSNFASIMNSQNVKQEDKIHFLLTCAGLIELRIYSYQSLKLEYRITPKRYILNSIKSKLLDEYRNSLLQSSQDLESPIKFQQQDRNLNYLKIASVNYCFIILIESDKELSSLFIHALHDIVAKFELDSRIYLHDIKKINQLLVNYINIPIAYPIEPTEFAPNLKQEKNKLIHDILTKEKLDSWLESELIADFDSMNLPQILQNKHIMEELNDASNFELDFNDPEFQ